MNIQAGRNMLFINNVVLELVKKKREAIKNTNHVPKDILDLLIAARDEETGFKLTDSELSAHAKT